MVMLDTPASNQKLNYYAGMFCITAATLTLQIVQTRILCYSLVIPAALLLATASR
jgi:hypothetical protein